ncbi:MAG: hypothetical protein LBQ88_15720 [Treponema sp.]|jgi:hypothetical protein|nr:hypothetical protein [Treponema sp.]
MSSVIKTITPFINKDLLLQALDKNGCNYTLQGNEIITDRVDIRGNQKFIWHNGKYLFQHDSHDVWRNLNIKELQPVSGFLSAVEKEYNAIYKKKLEELEQLRLAALAEAEQRRLEQERLRLEQERRDYVEKQRASIIAKAKEKGYSVREEKVKEKIKLVLVRTTY